MLRVLVFVIAALAAPALAQSALQVNCGDCGTFQAIQVLIDGVDSGTNQSVYIENLATGRHEVKVVKWVSPFSTEELYVGYLDFPHGVVLRAKASKGKLEVYGQGKYTPPPPPERVAQGPSADQRANARAWLDEAKEQLDDVKDRVEASDDECVGKLSGRLGALDDAIDDARAQTDRDYVDVATNKAIEAQRVLGSKCGKRNVTKWSKPLGRVVTKLQSAARSLR